ncbi:hypothetical protein [Rhabdothermincola sp.]|uniref:hypothetical protein n=1 Tax=Rhabdothermincola sp. TaxID=2820405 RepID=UPI002FE1BE6E
MRRRIVLVVVAIVLLGGVVACSGGSKPVLQELPGVQAMAKVREATVAAGTLRYEGTVTQGERSGELSGAAGASPPRGELTVPVFTPEAVLPASVRWNGDDVYIERVAVGDEDAKRAVPLFSRLGSDPPWARFGRSGLVGTLLASYDPFLLLDRLSAANVSLEPTAGDEVGDTSGTRYEAVGAVSDGSAGGARTELWVDDQARLRRVRVEGSGRVIDYRVLSYGDDVTVEPIPAEELADVTADPSQLATSKPDGDYQAVRSGTTAGVRWTLQRAPGTNGGSCWRLEADPPLTPVGEHFAPFPGGARCVLPPSPDEDLDQQIAVVVDADAAQTPYDALVVVVPPEVRSVEMAYPDGKLVPLEIDRATGTVVWISPPERPGVVLVVTDGDGRSVHCGPGYVSEIDDVTKLGPDEIANLRSLIWSCVAGED